MRSDRTASEVRMCAACPKMCRHVCPTFFTWRSDSPTPHGRALLIHQDIMGTRYLDERGIEILYQCLECSHCLTFCLPEIDIASIVEQERIDIVKQGRYPKKLKELKEDITNYGNPFGEPSSTRFEWFSHSEKNSGKRILYFTGCTASYREQSIAQNTVDVLTKLGYQVTILESEQCCGSPLLRTGFLEEGLEQAAFNVEQMNNSECDSIVFTCPGCYRVFAKDCPNNGIELTRPIQHISELLSSELDKLASNPEIGLVTYHDPCHLGRHLGVYEAPREVLKHLTEGKFVELDRHADNATCCGNGAGLRTLFPEDSHSIGAERIDHAIHSNADYLITACPFCKNMLHSESDGRIKVLDIPEFVNLISGDND